MKLLSPLKVMAAVEAELEYQDRKWGEDKPQSLPGLLLVMRKELEEAEDAWIKNRTGARQTCLEEVVQVVATGMQLLMKYGTEGSALATDDIPAPVVHPEAQ